VVVTGIFPKHDITGTSTITHLTYSEATPFFWGELLIIDCAVHHIHISTVWISIPFSNTYYCVNYSRLNLTVSLCLRTNRYDIIELFISFLEGIWLFSIIRLIHPILFHIRLLWEAFKRLVRHNEFRKF